MLHIAQRLITKPGINKVHSPTPEKHKKYKVIMMELFAKAVSAKGLGWIRPSRLATYMDSRNQLFFC